MGDYVFGLKAQGRYNGEPLTGTGKIGGMLALRGEGRHFLYRLIFALVTPVLLLMAL